VLRVRAGEDVADAPERQEHALQDGGHVDGSPAEPPQGVDHLAHQRVDGEARVAQRGPPHREHARDDRAAGHARDAGQAAERAQLGEAPQRARVEQRRPEAAARQGEPGLLLDAFPAERHGDLLRGPPAAPLRPGRTRGENSRVRPRRASVPSG